MTLTNGADGLEIPVGQPVVWTYTVTNVGNVPLSNVIVTDDHAAVTIGAPVKSGGNQDDVLDLGETWEYSATGTATAGNYTNVGRAFGTHTGCPSCPLVVNDTDPSNYFGSGPGMVPVLHPPEPLKCFCGRTPPQPMPNRAML